MKLEHIVWLIVLVMVVAAVWVTHAYNGTHLGRGYYMLKDLDHAEFGYTDLPMAEANKQLEEARAVLDRGDATPAEREQANKTKDSIQFSMARTIWIWIAAFLTLAVYSFLYRDNPIYKVAEHTFVGLTAAYYMVIAFWDSIVPYVIEKLFPIWTKTNLTPGLDLNEHVGNLYTKSFGSWLIDYEPLLHNGLSGSMFQMMYLEYWIPVVLSIMLLWRLSPVGGWISRWPLAFIIGAFSGMRLIAHLESDFIKQIEQLIVPLINLEYDARSGGLDFGRTFYASMNNLILIVGTLCALIYFFFSLEHKGLVGKASRVGIWVLMITFGAGFGYTVMGRIALLTGRLQFLLTDWLNVVPG